MELPSELYRAIDNVLGNTDNIASLSESAKEISERYRKNDNDGKRLLTENIEAVAYACSRMPATFGSVSTVLKSIFEYNVFDIKTVFDIGAGTGAATWAIYDALGKKEFQCFEREPEMIKIGKALMRENEDLKLVKWNEFDIINNEFKNNSDIIIVSYLINELNKDDIETVIRKLWGCANKILIIIEPGTPRGFSNIKDIRSTLLKCGGHIVAPCTHEGICELSKDDWCNFTCRIQRSKLHKLLKNGQAGFEDEKFSYIVFSKENIQKAKNRILRHPIINKGFSEFKVCSQNGINNIKISKRDGEIYKLAKKKSSGDSLILKEDL